MKEYVIIEEGHILETKFYIDPQDLILSIIILGMILIISESRK